MVSLVDGKLFSAAANSILTFAYGYHVQPKDDPYMELADRAMEGVKAAMNPGSYLVDFIPIRASNYSHYISNKILTCQYTVKYVPEWFPGATFKSQARVWKKALDDAMDVPWDSMKRTMVRLAAFSWFVVVPSFELTVFLGRGP